MAIYTTVKISASATALALLMGAPAGAQTVTGKLESKTVLTKAAPVLDAVNADVGGLGLSLAKAPQSVTVIGADLIAATGSQTLSQLIKLDASLADSYNTTGYIESMSVRGFLLDQGQNFQRNGLGVSNYAPVALENKERVEVLKGTSGLQSGVSAPGGLVNFVTKVPLAEPFTAITFGGNSYGGSKLDMDHNATWSGIGVRVNLAAENLQSHFDRANGSREFASVALAQTLASGTALNVDVEYHHKQQPSVPGLGLLDSNGDGVGDQLPATINPRLNLNNQTWSQPFESRSTTAQATVRHPLGADWQAQLGFGMQRTLIDDRIAFPDGCSNAPTYVYPGLCANGDVDVYDYRSEGEERNSWSWEATLKGKVQAAGIDHRLTLGLTGRGTSANLPALQAYNYVGSTNIFTPTALPPDATRADLSTNSSDRSVESHASVVSTLLPGLQAMAGLRNVHLSRTSERSNGSRALSLDQTVTTPWAALAWSPQNATMVFASWGQGVELESVPNRPTRYINYGEVLPALKSAQVEFGIKWQAQPRLLLSAVAFSIDKPYADDMPAAGGKLLRTTGDKVARHQGLELAATGQANAQLSMQTSLSLIDARFTQALDPLLTGQRITNVPRAKASLFADYKLTAWPGLSINGLLTSESGKTATADGSVTLPAAWQLDAGARWAGVVAGQRTVLRLQVENLTDRAYWREAPTQSWGGIYLFPSTPRTVRASVGLEF